MTTESEGPAIAYKLCTLLFQIIENCKAVQRFSCEELVAWCP